MIKEINLAVAAHIAYDEQLLKQEIAEHLALKPTDNFLIKPLRRSIDARSRNIKVNLKLVVWINEPVTEDDLGIYYKEVSNSKSSITIIGAGPAGLYAALRCLEIGIKPVIFERGKDVQARRRDLAAINKEQIVNPESNYCFGEGGAGTYSDGKLYTRSSKRGDIEHILKTFVYHGADDVILVDAHPHIGTNKLPKIISNMRETILKNGGEIHFHSKLIDINYKDDKISSILIEKTLVILSDLPEKIGGVEGSGNDNHTAVEHACSHLILATGHSARDIYELLDRKKIAIEAKPFALGVRVEHPQEFIDKIQYSCHTHDEVVSKRGYLPASSYSLVHQAKGHGVYSFCMCPGGIIAPCATSQEEVVTNGWSPSKRNNPYANSGIVVGLELLDFEPYKKFGALAGLQLQKEIERKAWQSGGKTQTAPAQNLQDFVNNKVSNKLIDCSYQPGTQSVQMTDVVGKMIGATLQQGFKAFDNKMRGYISNEAIIVGVESRTSTPVRIPRDKTTLQHIQLKNLYPCAEGAGYAGGIVSAAMDGVNCVNAIAALY
ncbi:MAG: FAD-binding protein [Burkholderiales bacterium]|nr:FAD-binding protein [Bacteroidia bacterium]